MKKSSILLLIQSLFFFSLVVVGNTATAQSGKDKDLIEDCNTAKEEFIKTDSLMQSLFRECIMVMFFSPI
jgi:hypothetical protein